MRRLVLFAKDPVVGRAKTRLATGVGRDEAVALYRAFLTDLSASLRTGAWECVLAHDADEAGEELRALFVPPWRRRRQGRGDLGDRLRRTFSEARRDGADATVVAGSDAPTLRGAAVDGAFTALDEADAVVAPSPDGGYALVGLSRDVDPGPLFQDVRWSTAGALQDTLEGLRRARLTVALLPAVADVDEVADLDRLHAALAADLELAPATRRALRVVTRAAGRSRT